MPKQPNVLTAAEVAKQKGVARQAIYQAAERGTLNAVRLGRTLLILRDRALDTYLAQEPQATGARGGEGATAAGEVS